MHFLFHCITHVQGLVDKMFQMLMTLAAQPEVRLSANSYERALEALVGRDQWKEALLVVRAMDKAGLQPSL